MKADVEVMRKGLQADLKGAADAWKEMPSTIGIKTSGRKITKETAIETPPNLEEKLLAIINQHVEGITLPEVAKELGIVTIVLGKAAKALLEQGKVRKEEKTYFPVII
jgi:YesN/AraC family two-component response regulator